MSGLDLATFDTTAKIVRHWGRTVPGETAWREKHLGIWRGFTWAEVAARVRDIALGLRALGLGQGDVIGLLGDSRPDWAAGYFAAHAVRAMSLGIYRDALDQEVAFLIDHAGAALVLAENEEQVDKLLNLGDRVPSLRHIVYAEPRGMRKYDDPRLLSLDGLIERGRALARDDPGLWDTLVDGGRGEDIATLCTTSGTTSNPKLAMLTGIRFLRQSAAYLAADPMGPDDEYVSVLPMPWIAEQVYALGVPLLSRMTVNFVEEAATMMADMREIGPTLLLQAPRAWEATAADIKARILDASPLKRRLYDIALGIGMAAAAKGKRSWLADQLLFRALRDRYGFSKLRSATTGGAAMGPDTFRLFQAMGIPLRQLYGQTEAVGVYTLHRPDDIDIDSVGVPLTPDIEIRIDRPDGNGVGEIVTRHPNLFLGYYKNEAATKEALVDGWLRTGDAGYLTPKGHLVVIDRIKDIATTSRGDLFSPQYVENKLKFSPYVGEAVALGDGKPFVAALLCVRFSIVAKWAERARIAFTTYTDLSNRAEVRDIVRAEVEKVNASLPEAQRIRRFVLLYKELDADDGELTRTRKVRRNVINERYAEIIDGLYAGRARIPVDAVISFQDGSKTRIKTEVEVVDLFPETPMARAAE